MTTNNKWEETIRQFPETPLGKNSIICDRNILIDFISKIETEAYNRGKEKGFKEGRDGEARTLSEKADKIHREGYELGYQRGKEEILNKPRMSLNTLSLLQFEEKRPIFFTAEELKNNKLYEVGRQETLEKVKEVINSKFPNKKGEFINKDYLLQELNNI